MHMSVVEHVSVHVSIHVSVHVSRHMCVDTCVYTCLDTCVCACLYMEDWKSKMTFIQAAEGKCPRLCVSVCTDIQ